MSSRSAPQRIRARYLRALKAMPMPVALTDPPDPSRLTVLGTEAVAGRTVRFGTVAAAPRLWMALGEPTEAAEATRPGQNVGPGQAAGPLLGYVTGLVVGEPDLWVCEGAHREWVLDTANAEALKRAASRVWFSCIQDCEG